MHQNETGSTESREAICPQCKKPFTPKKSWQRFDTASCRSRFHQEKATVESLAKRVDELERRMDAITKALP